jgi:hypothetical protein
MTATTSGPPLHNYPLHLDGALDRPISRWLWLVKWLLVIPHYLLLVFLWIAFFVLTVAAWVAILFTGRYPRGIFDFNVGVLRWSWRVAYYAYGALGTDRYPPFTLHDVSDYPAHLDVEYPARLSRGLIFVKWLLAIPHLLLVGIFAGGGTWIAWQSHDGQLGWLGGGLIGLLVLVAAISLLFTGRYPDSIFDLVLGLNRWCLRVAAYVGLMTDIYPPFRLDQGGDDSALLVPPGPSTAPSEVSAVAAPESPAMPDGAVPSAAESTHRWTGGRVVSVVAGSVVTVTAFGVCSLGLAALLADQVAREDGYVTSPEHTYSTQGYALVTDPIELSHDAFVGPAMDSLVGTIRVRASATDSRSVFIGVAPTADVNRYLAGASYSTVSDTSSRASTYVSRAEDQRPGLPGAQRFWTAEVSGTGRQALTWSPESGSWTVVVMDLRAQRGVEARLDGGVEAPGLAELGWILLLAGALGIGAGVIVIRLAFNRAGRSQTRSAT